MYQSQKLKIMCHMSHVACHMSHVTCHMSDITFQSSANAQYLIFVLQKSFFNSGSSCVEVGSLDQAQLRMKKKTKIEKFSFLRITLAIQYILGYNFFFFCQKLMRNLILGSDFDISIPNLVKNWKVTFTAESELTGFNGV